jgi:hypothetical protein
MKKRLRLLPNTLSAIAFPFLSLLSAVNLPILEDSRCFFEIQWIESILSRRIKFRLKPMFQSLSFWEYFMLMTSSRTLNVPIFFAQKQKNLEVLICHPDGMEKISCLCLFTEKLSQYDVDACLFPCPPKKVYLYCTRSTYIQP